MHELSRGRPCQRFYKQFDDLIDLYDIKFAKPTTAIMTELTPLDEKLELTYDELWHHEGHGAAMSAPDYAWWPGIYEVAKTFYFSFLPEVKDLAGEKFADELLEKYVYNQPGHRWLKEGMSKEQLQKIEEFYRQRYGDQK